MVNRDAAFATCAVQRGPVAVYLELGCCIQAVLA
jgi:hypothetical protein